MPWTRLRSYAPDGMSFPYARTCDKLSYEDAWRIDMNATHIIVEGRPLGAIPAIAFDLKHLNQLGYAQAITDKGNGQNMHKLIDIHQRLIRAHRRVAPNRTLASVRPRFQIHSNLQVLLAPLYRLCKQMYIHQVHAFNILSSLTTLSIRSSSLSSFLIYYAKPSFLHHD